MATILNQVRVCDGYDVRCRLADGRLQTFHFPDEPPDAQAAVDEAEAALVMAAAPAACTPEGMEMMTR